MYVKWHDVVQASELEGDNSSLTRDIAMTTAELYELRGQVAGCRAQTLYTRTLTKQLSEELSMLQRVSPECMLSKCRPPWGALSPSKSRASAEGHADGQGGGGGGGPWGTVVCRATCSLLNKTAVCNRHCKIELWSALVVWKLDSRDSMLNSHISKVCSLCYHAETL